MAEEEEEYLTEGTCSRRWPRLNAAAPRLMWTHPLILTTPIPSPFSDTLVSKETKSSRLLDRQKDETEGWSFPQQASVVLIGQTITASFNRLGCHRQGMIYSELSVSSEGHTHLRTFCTLIPATLVRQQTLWEKGTSKEPPFFSFSSALSSSLITLLSFLPSVLLAVFSHLAFCLSSLLPPWWLFLAFCFLMLILSPLHSPKPRNMTLRQTTLSHTHTHTFYKHTDRSKVRVDEWDYMSWGFSIKSFLFIWQWVLQRGLIGFILFYWDPRIISERVSVSGRRSPNMTGRHLKVKSEVGTSASP